MRTDTLGHVDDEVLADLGRGATVASASEGVVEHDTNMSCSECGVCWRWKIMSHVAMQR
jgi:hypothetical protein